MNELRSVPALCASVDLLDAFLDEVDGSEAAMFSLLARQGSHNPPWFDVKAIEFFLRNGYNVSRIRPLIPSLNFFRVIYGIDPQVDEFHLLAVGMKILGNQFVGIAIPDRFKYNYEPACILSDRVREEYAESNLARISPG